MLKWARENGCGWPTYCHLDFVNDEAREWLLENDASSWKK
jgi:hypothetical protein